MGRATVRAFTDGHIRKDMPDRPFHISSLLWVVGDGRPDEAWAHLWCPRPFPLGAVVTSATLVLHSRDPAGIGGTLVARRTNHRFVVTSTTWNTRPAAVPDSAVSATRSSIPWNARWELDVLSHMRAISGGADWWGWRIQTSTSNLPLRLHSADARDFRPELVVEWSDAPSRPTGMSPSGNRAVSREKPVLTYVFNDVSGDTDLAATRVQVHTSAITSGTPMWSGEVATTEPVVDLATTDYPGNPVNSSRWWRASAQDGAGVWGNWGDWAQWQRRAKPTLTITSPTVDQVVEDPAPVIRWSVSGGTQSAYEVVVWDGTRTVRRYYSGKIASTSARSHALPPGVLNRDNGRFFVVVRIWDQYARAPQPGDNPDVAVRHGFIFDRDGSINPAGLTLAPTSDRVGMVLSWTRSIDPGSWVVLRDGEIVTQLDSSDVRVATGRWSWTDWGAHPRRDHTWEVAPVLGGKAGKGTAVAGPRLEPVGVWLVWPSDGTRVCLTNTGDDLSGITMVEQSTSHLPLGARRPVLITQGMGGYQGTIEGTTPGEEVLAGTAGQWRDRVLALKERQGQTMRLALHDQNMPVTVWEMGVWPAPAGDKVRFGARFSFAQVAEFDYTPAYL